MGYKNQCYLHQIHYHQRNKSKHKEAFAKKVIERYTFKKRKQLSDETIVQFITELKNVSIL